MLVKNILNFYKKIKFILLNIDMFLYNCNYVFNYFLYKFYLNSSKYDIIILL